MTSRGCSPLLLAAVALLAACNGDDDTTASTRESAVSASTVAPTTEVTTPPIAQSTTTAPLTTIVTTGPTTSAPTSSPTSVALTTDPPTTTVPPPSTGLLTEEERALAAVEAAHRVWLDCIRDVAVCDTSNFSDYFVDPGLTGARDQISEAQANGYVVDNADLLTYEVLEVHLSGAIPYVVVCQTDGSSLVERRQGEPDRIVEGGYNEKIREVQLVRTPLGWRVEGYATVEEVVGQVGALCG